MNSAEASVQTMYPAIAKIVGRGEVQEQKDGQALSVYYGSGIYVAEQGDFGLVLTNWHVVDGSTGLLQVQFPNFTSQGAVILIDKIWDLTAIVINRPPFLPLPISLEVPQIGDELWVAGYGQESGLEGFQMSSGPVLCYSFLNAESFSDVSEPLPGETVTVGTGVRHGDSGGPILNRYGEVAGLLWGSDGFLTMGTFCLRVQAFLTQAQCQMRDRTETAGEFFDLAARGKIVAKKISMPTVPAQQALASSGIYPISRRPVYRRGELPGGGQKNLPVFYKPTVRTDVALHEGITPPSTDAAEPPTRSPEEVSDPGPEFVKAQKKYRAEHRDGFSLPPYPPVESPTLAAQSRTIGRDHPETFVVETAAQSVSSDAEPSNAKSSNAEPSNAESSNAESSNAESSNAESSNAESSNVGVEDISESLSPTRSAEAFQNVSLSDEVPESVLPAPSAGAGTNEGSPEKKSIKEMIPGLPDIPLSDVQTIIVMVVILFLFVNSLRLLAIAAERPKKSKEK